MHNDSAMRSRSKLNANLDELWNLIPIMERWAFELDGGSKLSRADRVAFATIYIRKLQAEKERQDTLSPITNWRR